MHRLLLLLCLSWWGSVVSSQCTLNPLAVYHVPVYAVMSNDVQGYVHVSVHGPHLNLTFLPATNFTFHDFKSITTASLDRLPVNHVTRVANLQMFTHHVILAGPSVICVPDPDVCCVPSEVPVLSVYVSGKNVDMPEKWQTGVLDGVPVNGENRLGGTYVSLRDLMSTAVSFDGALPSVRGASLTRLLKHIVENQKDRVTYRAAPTRNEEVRLVTLETLINVPEDVRANFWELVAEATAKKDVDLLVRVMYLFYDGRPIPTEEMEDEVLDLTEEPVAQDFAEVVASTAKLTVVGSPPRPPLDPVPRKTLADKILEFLASCPEGETHVNIAKGVKKSAAEVLRQLDDLFQAELVQAVHQLNGKKSIILYRLP